MAAPVIVESTNTTSGLKHPGCLQSAAEINALATALAANDPYRDGLWSSMMSNVRGRIDKTDWIPPMNFVSAADYASPAKYAGAGLIRYVNDWIINGNTTSEANAITMLNTWAGVQSFIPAADDPYEGQSHATHWFGYLAHAADLLISSNTSWPVAEQNAFKDMMRTVILPVADGKRMVGFNGNWDLSATWAVMAMAVLLDDRALFDEQVAWLKEGETNARISYYLLASGQNQESARDQGHSIMGLEFLSLSAQTAWTQGVDLYEYDNRSVARAFEYNAAYNMGTVTPDGEDNLPFQVYPCAVGSNSAHDTNTVIFAGDRYRHPDFHEMVYNHYKNYRGIELPHVKSMMENHTRPEEPNGNGSNHHSALYWNLDLSADAALRNAQSADSTLAIDTNFSGRASLRLNCGGAHYGATDGRAFTKEKSQWDDGGSSISHSNPIANTPEEKLYQSYRQGGTSGSIYYHFGLPNGAYRVKLHFAEPSYTQANQRKFNVYLEGIKTLDNFDIFAVAGANTATVYETTLTLADGQLDVQLQAVTSRPILSAIEIEPLVPLFSLTYTAGPNGMLNGTTPQSVNPKGDGTAITAVPGFGYRFVDWSDGRTENPRTDLSVTSNISVTANFAAINPNKVIIIKADDFRTPSQQWIDFVDVSRSMGIKVGLGAIVAGTSASSTQQWMKDQDTAEDVEFWNHGWEHTVANILIDMPLAQEGLRAATGRTPAAFGPPYNSWNADVAAAVNAAPEVKLVFTHGPSTVEGQCPGVHAVKIKSENAGVGIPDAALFKADYPLGSTPGPLSLQFHPSGSAWANNNSMTEYTNIVQYLLDDGYSILLPTEYLALVEPKVTLTYTASANGSLSGETIQEVPFGTRSATPVSAMPDNGSHFVDWSDGSTDNPRIDENVTSNISVTALFEPNAPSTLIYLAGPGGSISGPDSQTVAYGADGSAVTASASNNHYFVNWSDAITDNPRTDLLVQDDISVTANFATNILSGSIGINFGSDMQSMSTSDTAGVIPAPNWNNFAGGSGTVLDLLSGDGMATTLDVSYSAETTWQDGGTTTSDEKMMRGYLDGSTSGTLPTVTVSQVPYARYDVYIYHQVDVDANGGSVILNGTESKYIKDAPGTFSGSAGDYIEEGQGTDFSSTTAGHYVKFTGVTGTTFSITSTRDLDRVGFAGMQIVSTPLTYTLTYTAGPNGSISGATSQTVASNADGTSVLAIADAGYRFVDWSDASQTNPRTDVAVINDMAATANFTIENGIATTNSLSLVDLARIVGGSESGVAQDNTGSLALKDATGSYMRIAMIKADLSTLSGSVQAASLSFDTKNDVICNVYVWGVVDSNANGWDWTGGVSGDVTWDSVIANGLFTPKDHLYSTYGSELVLLGTSAIVGDSTPYDLTHTINGTSLVDLLNADTDDILTLVVAVDANVSANLRNPITYSPQASLQVVTVLPLLDTDGDGLTDAQELALGTNPNDPNSGFGIDGTPLPTIGKVQITWPSANGVLYRVWNSSNLINWTVARDWAAASTPPDDTLELDLTPSNGFFKVEAQIQ